MSRCTVLEKPLDYTTAIDMRSQRPEQQRAGKLPNSYEIAMESVQKSCQSLLSLCESSCAVSLCT